MERNLLVCHSVITALLLGYLNLTLTDVTPDHVVKILHQGAGADSGAAADVYGQFQGWHQLAGEEIKYNL